MDQGSVHNQVHGGVFLVIPFAPTVLVSLDGIQVDASFSRCFANQLQGFVKHFGEPLPEGFVEPIFFLQIAELPFDQFAIQAARSERAALAPAVAIVVNAFDVLGIGRKF
jgi:hypothetical protein